MKTVDQVLESYKSHTMDGRDLERLSDFIPEDKLHLLNMELNEEYKGKHVPIPLTRENVLSRLEEDVRFGHEKAVNQRGISSYLMFEVVTMWNWILEEGLEDFEEYGSYGMPLFKATAEKYGFKLAE